MVDPANVARSLKASFHFLLYLRVIANRVNFGGRSDSASDASVLPEARVNRRRLIDRERGPRVNRLEGACMATLGCCRLCLQQRELRSSHLIPKSMYKLLRSDESSNPNPFIHGADRSLQTSKQAQQHLLCHDCEQRFSKRGEAWVMSHCWRSVEEFRIQQILLKSNPIIENDALKVYAGSAVPELDMDKLVYFGASVFWRAAACEWSLLGERIRFSSVLTARNFADIYWMKRRSHAM